MNKNSKPTLSIIIPVFNEKNTVEKSIQRIVKLPISKEIIVVEDCSKDGSREIIEKIRPKYSFTFLKNDINSGKGASVLKAIPFAHGEYIIVEDSDLELNPQNILEMLSEIEKGEYDLINGNRNVIKQKNTNFISKIAKIITSVMLRVLYGRNINDLLSSYKLCKLEKFKTLDMKSKRFGFETEWIIRALKKHWRIKEMPIDYTPRKASEGKKITVKDGIDIIANIIKYRFQD